MLRSRPAGPADDERGTVLVLFALTMVVLLVMVAFVVDLGAGYSERIQDQNAADAAALAGAQQLGVSSARAAHTAMNIARANLATSYTESQWKSIWSSCRDPGRGAAGYPNVAAASPCISFNNGFTRIRVRLPSQIVRTEFATIIGVKTLQTAAAAEAEVVPPAGGGVLPFGVAGGFTADSQNQICATTGGGCGGGNSDTLRALDSPLVGNPQFGGTRICRPNGFGVRIEYSSAMGLDHLTAIKAGGELRRLDDCDVELPNTVHAEGLQGMVGGRSTAAEFIQDLGRGLISGPTSRATYPDGGPARLRRIPNFAGWPTRQVGGYRLDDRPLWDFIPDTTLSGVPASCQRRNFNPGTQAKMQRCLADYVKGGYTAPIFTARSPGTPPNVYDIQLSPRAAFVPTLNCGCPDGGSGLGPISAYNLIYIQTLYLNRSDTAYFNPGEGGTGPLSIAHFDGISALRITNNMVPVTVVATGANGALRGASVQLVR